MSSSQRIELTQVILGMQPYVLIEADVDPADGELVLKVKAGGGATEMIGALPLMMVTQLPADQNPLTIAIGEYLAEFPAHREALTGFAEILDVPMPADGAR
jgi:hypothetical protein